MKREAKIALNNKAAVFAAKIQESKGKDQLAREKLDKAQKDNEKDK